jgi:hypothetical protein
LDILWRFGIFYDRLVHFVFIWYIFSGFGIMYREKSGNPVKVQLDRNKLNFLSNAKRFKVAETET